MGERIRPFPLQRRIAKEFVGMEKLCISYCRANGLEFFPNTKYKVEYNPIDKCLRIYNCWGGTIVPAWFINANFV